jgi:hypothetical protein
MMLANLSLGIPLQGLAGPHGLDQSLNSASFNRMISSFDS